MAAGSFAFSKKILKLSQLAYSTISHLGLIVCFVCLVHHLLLQPQFSTSLTMQHLKQPLSYEIAGIIDHETGTRDLRKLSGIWQLLPLQGH